MSDIDFLDCSNIVIKLCVYNVKLVNYYASKTIIYTAERAKKGSKGIKYTHMHLYFGYHVVIQSNTKMPLNISVLIHNRFNTFYDATHNSATETHKFQILC